MQNNVLFYIKEISERKTNYTRLIEKLSNEDPVLSQTNNENKADTKQSWISIARKKDSNEVIFILLTYLWNTNLKHKV